ncbi:potassium channel family protein [Phyllobacterium endophyticum]|uniref:Ion transporter n=1 Tax=Phyllobacterium endophyticum TaxID=1149773 RepID=A0A2P7B034_9HYPH|nr:potassium channel family protein [Phyllobacterium endophyticum]MBB3235539.1 voltage-gated potassium channel [Phyllobacterium endophyticum]PSH59823.1 ion transporter [Phyllobacterium endophyticum]TXR47963.1 potassium channel family protein [Phyllobacterium endophyticum]TYR41972.1 potassium channel family protein [Phyllobacterium endophyticum]
MRKLLSELYEGNTDRAHLFRYVLLVFDIITILFVIGTSFLPRSQVVEWVDAGIGLIILLDVLARFSIGEMTMRSFFRPSTIADLVAIFSFLAPLSGEGFGFLRILRTVRLLHTYQVLARLRIDFPFVRQHEDALIAVINLLVFLFIMTGLVYETQHRTNAEIANYADALYFTVTALTTTGFGDITLEGTTGRLISVSIMIFGVTLFLRLAQVLFRPNKVRYVCSNCGLSRHDADAVHCKDCGAIVHIENEGES